MAVAKRELTSNETTPHAKSEPITDETKLVNGLPLDEIVVDVERLIFPVGTGVRTNDANPADETHYVLVIHGTFAQPKLKGRVNWFHPDPEKASDNFCTRIAVQLSCGHFGEDAVWRALPDPELLPSGVNYPFYWDGSNTDEGRKNGAWQLAKLIRHIANRDPSARIHLVAHSHGGNVALKAIEQYVQKLEPRSAEEDWPDAVRERFQTVHQAQADEIARWRKVDGVPWWMRGLPFLVVWRGQKGELPTAGKDRSELYPWGYFRSVDALLNLGRRRKTLYLCNRRMTSPISNALGKTVFLGTPFYCKQWVSWAVLRILLSFLVSLVLGFALTWLAVYIWAGVCAFETDDNVIMFLAVGLTALLFFAELMGFADRTMFRSGNMYHSNTVPWSPAQHALVIQAGKLDEAALALSAEPAARAFLLPLVRRATARAGFVALPRRPAAHAPPRARAFFYMALFRAVVLNLVLLFPRIIFWLISKIVVRNTFNTIRSVLMGLAFGLDTANLKNARIFVEETLELGGSPRNIHTWDVRRLLAQAEERGLARTWVEDFAREQPEGNGNCNERIPAGTKGEALDDGKPFGRTSLQRAVSESVSVDSSGSFRETPVGTGGSFDGSEFASGTNLRSGGAAAPEGSNGMNGVPSSAASAYSFLWDDAELIARSDSSPMYNKLRGQLPSLDHNPRLTSAQFARDLRSLCCVVEARFWEIRNQWQLTHATYYRNQEIVEAIVAFLDSSKVPLG
ncbi:hypothetical protein KFL_000700210 [Klebsormidium nitens]|uniref:Uncharacterized protein n=1 Tax=Klebsormidium nitens TaxID=105231 RepID=A0A1Y1HR24_KLENI|nr:hypothetical protein KFL_000700210 [Klebsormidium nitens]|eukprot:GAQ81084.1 hypothetical protein KFL_000700210 [Klebsormidium nitens]